ncbi:hypothetical protein NDU88_000812 [Pleurodeles waltl]|uniref:Uncharacterized protein n=1 Tax=Pleurodeles waltl TaxID=8319 RepID=A0AAV7WKS2_PLEWA|nr:hypothetical protein NDU88_000812 [Pleurodeles waltl]
MIANNEARHERCASGCRRKVNICSTGNTRDRSTVVRVALTVLPRLVSREGRDMVRCAEMTRCGDPRRVVILPGKTGSVVSLGEVCLNKVRRAALSHQGSPGALREMKSPQ